MGYALVGLCAVHCRTLAARYGRGAGLFAHDWRGFGASRREGRCFGAIGSAPPSPPPRPAARADPVPAGDDSRLEECFSATLRPVARRNAPATQRRKAGKGTRPLRWRSRVGRKTPSQRVSVPVKAESRPSQLWLFTPSCHDWLSMREAVSPMTRPEVWKFPAACAAPRRPVSRGGSCRRCLGGAWAPIYLSAQNPNPRIPPGFAGDSAN